MEKLILCFALALSLGACKGDEPERTKASSDEATVPPPAATPVVPIDAGKTPTAEEAAALVRNFSSKLLDEDLVGARELIRIPPDFRAKQIDYFLRELQSPENLTMAGVSAVLEQEFGPLKERFGDQAEHVASKLGLPLDRLYAFGDTKAAALLVWDGTKLKVAAVHRLSAP